MYESPHIIPDNFDRIKMGGGIRPGNQKDFFAFSSLVVQQAVWAGALFCIKKNQGRSESTLSITGTIFWQEFTDLIVTRFLSHMRQGSFKDLIKHLRDIHSFLPRCLGITQVSLRFWPTIFSHSAYFFLWSLCNTQQSSQLGAHIPAISYPAFISPTHFIPVLLSPAKVIFGTLITCPLIASR